MLSILHLIRHGYAVPPSPQGEGKKEQPTVRSAVFLAVQSIEPLRADLRKQAGNGETQRCVLG